MPKFAANLSFIFWEVGFLDRFAAAAQCGSKAVEYLGAYEYPPEAVAARLEANGLTQALFNMPPGDWAKGECGTAALPGRESEFRAGVDKALAYAKTIRCRLVHAMAGLCPDGEDRGAAERVYIDTLRHAAERLAPEGLTIIIEPINTRDIPGYFLNTTRQAMAIIDRVGLYNLQLQLDLYHVQVMEGDLEHKIRSLAGRYPHMQIAGDPGRHEPDIGEINYPYLFDLLDEIGHAGGSVASTGRRVRPARGSAGLGASASPAEHPRARHSGVITGTCGFLGRRLAALSLAHGSSLGPIDDLVLCGSAAPSARLPDDRRLTLVTGDIADRATLGRLLSPGAAAVFHLSAVVSSEAEADADADLGYRVNLDGTRTVLDACRALARARASFSRVRSRSMAESCRPRSARMRP